MTELSKFFDTQRLNDLYAANHQAVEAIIQSGSVTAKGLETLTAEILAVAKHQAEDSIAAAKAAMGAKTYQELVDIQADYTKSVIDSFVSDFIKIGEMSVKLMEDGLSPVMSMAKAGFSKMGIAAA